MSSKRINLILKEMDTLEHNFHKLKASFPYMGSSSIGAKSAATAPYYQQRGHNIRFIYTTPLMQSDVDENNAVSHYINQNFIVRLYALLESHKIVSDKIKIDKNLDGWEDMEILRRLRNYFSHSSGKYNPQKKEQKKTVDAIIKKYDLGIKNPQDFPLSIGTVIEPMFHGCKKYVKNKLK